MVDIVSVSTADILSKLPEVVPWDSAILNNEAVDLLVCCAGFEDRSIAVIEEFATVNVHTALIIQYPTNPSENAFAREAFEGVSHWDNKVDIVYDRRTFLSTIRSEFRKWSDHPAPRIIVDLSGMASYVIYRVLYGIWEELAQARLAVFYAEATDYAPSRSEWEKFYGTVADPTDNLSMAESYEQTYFQSRGVDITYESDAFAGQNIGPLATLVVAIPSFSLQRMKSMIAHVESQYNVRPTDVRWFLGQPPDKVHNGWRFDALAALYNVQDHGVGVSTRDFQDVLQRLDTLWDEQHCDRHLVIANLGSKMQHLGCFLFLALHRECGLLLCEPREFIGSNYSKGIGPRWWLDFGLVNVLRAALECRGDLRFDWT